MKRRKPLYVVFVLVMLVAMLAGCGGKSSSTSSTNEGNTSTEVGTIQEAADEAAGVEVSGNMKIGVCMINAQHEFWKAISDTVVADANAKGIEVVATDGNGDTTKTVSDFENLMAQGCTAIVMDLVSESGAFVDVVAEAVSQGIHVISVDSDVVEACPVTAKVLIDTYPSGRMVGNWVGKKMEGQSVKALVMSGEMGSTVGQWRRSSILEGIMEYQMEKTTRTDVTVVQQFYADGWNAEVASQKIEDIAPTVDINIMISEADQLTLSCLATLDNVGLLGNILIVNGAGGSIDGLKAIVDGKIDATALNSPIELGHLGFTTAVRLFNGEDVPFVVYTSPTCITKENVDEFYNPNAAY